MTNPRFIILSVIFIPIIKSKVHSFSRGSFTRKNGKISASTPPALEFLDSVIYSISKPLPFVHSSLLVAVEVMYFYRRQLKFVPSINGCFMN